jgi:predicted transcriptional regulator
MATLSQVARTARESKMAGERTIIELAAEIAAAFVSNNSVRPADLPALIGDIHGALQRFSSGAVAVAEPEKLTPAVPIKKSVGDDYVVCLEDGRKFKSLKRHLRTAYNLTPQQYRAKWGLPSDYPMVAPAYAKARSALAHQMGLGQKRRKGRK